MSREEELNLRQYIVSQRIVISNLNDRIQNLVDDVEALREHIKISEHSHAMLYASRQVEGPL